MLRYGLRYSPVVRSAHSFSDPRLAVWKATVLILYFHLLYAVDDNSNSTSSSNVYGAHRSSHCKSLCQTNSWRCPTIASDSLIRHVKWGKLKFVEEFGEANLAFLLSTYVLISLLNNDLRELEAVTVCKDFRCIRTLKLSETI